MGPRAGLDGRIISPPTGILSPDSLARNPVAIPTGLPGYTRYLLYGRLDGAQGRPGRADNLAPTGILSPDSLARSPVAIPTGLPSPLSLALVLNYFSACFTQCHCSFPRSVMDVLDSSWSFLQSRRPLC